MHNSEVVAIGRGCVDHLMVVPYPPVFDDKIPLLEYCRDAGGQAANLASALSRLGIRTSFIGKVGCDDSGRFILKRLRDFKVDVSGAIICKGRSPQAFIMVERKTGRRTIIYEPPSFAPIKKVPLHLLQPARIIFVDPQETEAGIALARRLRGKGIRFAYDAERRKPHLEEMLSLTDILTTSEHFPTEFTGEKDLMAAGKRLKRMGPEILVISLGEKGSLAFWKDRVIREPAFKVRAKDTTGAGDAFHAGLLYGLLKGWEIRETLRFASAVGAICCLKLGCREGLPTSQEAMAFMKHGLSIARSSGPPAALDE